MANDIVRQSEAPDISGEAIQDAEDKAEFLNREVQYSQQLHSVLRGIQRVSSLLSEVETAKNERRILESLRLLERIYPPSTMSTEAQLIVDLESWAMIDGIGVSRTCRVMKLLDMRSSELRSAVHEVFDHTWKALVHIDIESHRVAIHDTVEGTAILFANLYSY